MFGKVFSLYLVALLFVITVSLYASLSGLNIKTLDIWKEIYLGIFFLLNSATLFYFCNSAHNFANIVRYQKTLFENIYTVRFVYITV